MGASGRSFFFFLRHFFAQRISLAQLESAPVYSKRGDNARVGIFGANTNVGHFGAKLARGFPRDHFRPCGRQCGAAGDAREPAAPLRESRSSELTGRMTRASAQLAVPASVGGASRREIKPCLAFNSNLSVRARRQNDGLIAPGPGVRKGVRDVWQGSRER